MLPNDFFGWSMVAVDSRIVLSATLAIFETDFVVCCFMLSGYIFLKKFKRTLFNHEDTVSVDKIKDYESKEFWIEYYKPLELSQSS